MSLLSYSKQSLIKYGKNAFWLLEDKFFGLGFNLVVGIWAVCYLEPENFGTFTYSIAFIALIITFIFFGLNGILVKVLPFSITKLVQTI